MKKSSQKNMKHQFTKDELEACGYGELFEKDSLKLPINNMLMFDRITNINENEGKYQKGSITAELDIHPDLWFFKCHFINDPVMPGCLGLDALWQLSGFFLTWQGIKGKGRALGAKNINFSGEILPHHKKVTYVIDVKKIIKRSTSLIVSDAEVLVDKKQIYKAEGLKVGAFSQST